MKENTQEKNLIEKNSKSIFGKIKNLFKSLFTRRDVRVQEEVDNNNVVENNNNNEFKEYIKITEDEETKLLELQKRYRRGEIGEKDLTDEQIEDLCALYDKQIEEIQKTIDIKSQKLAECKKRKQEKIENNNS